MEINYYYDSKGFYTHQLPANVGSLPPQNAVRLAPTFEAGFWPQLVDGTWQNKENHTNRAYDGQTQTPTDYWMPNDTWDTPARHMTEFGPLPEGALLAAPDKPLEVAKAEAKSRLKAYRQGVEYGGFVLYYKRLERGSFLAPHSASGEVSYSDLVLMIEGIEVLEKRQRKRYEKGV